MFAIDDMASELAARVEAMEGHLVAQGGLLDSRRPRNAEPSKNVARWRSCPVALAETHSSGLRTNFLCHHGAAGPRRSF